MIEKRQTKTVIVNNVELHYVESGEGPPVLFVHGSLSDFRTWGFQRRFFSKDYRVIAYSRRYHYPNAPAGEQCSYSVEMHADDLAGLIKTQRLGAVPVIGSSYGAYVALLTAVRQPELVRSLVIAEPPMFPVLRNDAQGAVLLKTFLKTVWDPSVRSFEADRVEEGARIFYEGITAAGSYDKLTSSARKGMLENARPLKAEALCRVPFPEFTTAEAARIQSPCLLLTGERSPELFHRITDILADLLPGAERAVIAGASHSMHTDNSGLYNEVVADFLKRNSGRGELRP